MPTRTPNSSGIYTYAHEYEQREATTAKGRELIDKASERAMRDMWAYEEEKLKRWSRPYIKKGYRFDELTAIHTPHPKDGSILLLTALGLAKDAKLPNRFTLWLRRQWRRVRPYGVAQLGPED